MLELPSYWAGKLCVLWGIRLVKFCLFEQLFRLFLLFFVQISCVAKTGAERPKPNSKDRAGRKQIKTLCRTCTHPLFEECINRSSMCIWRKSSEIIGALGFSWVTFHPDRQHQLLTALVSTEIFLPCCRTSTRRPRWGSTDCFGDVVVYMIY